MMTLFFVVLAIFLLIPYFLLGIYFWQLFNTGYYKPRRNPKDMDKGA